MGRIVVIEDPFDRGAAHHHWHDGLFIDWLEEHYPDGFEYPHVVALNLRRLPVEDYDTRLTDDDALVLTFLPGVPAAAFVPTLSAAWSAVAAFAINTAISVAVSYSLNALFGPKASSPTAPKSLAAGGAAAAGSVYSMSIPQNTARVGQPIPVPYGNNLVVPDQAMQPYSYFANNEMYVVQMMCIGQGDYDIEEIKIGGSEADDLLPGIFQNWVFGPADHKKTFGIIQNSLDSNIFENVYTSAEVSDQALYSGKGGAVTYSAQMWNGCWDDCDYGILGIFWLSPEAAEFAEAMRNGIPVYMVVPNGVNAGTWLLRFIVNSGTTQGGDRTAQSMHKKGNVAGYYDVNNNFVSSIWKGNQNSTVTLSYTKPTSVVEGGSVGPFAACPPTTKTAILEYDVIWPSGCYLADPATGVLTSFKVSGEFVAETIDDIGNPTGTTYKYSWTETFSTNTPQRRTYRHAVPPGRYRVTGSRLTNESDRAVDRSRCLWTGLKAVLGGSYDGSAVEVYGDVTLLMSRVRATEGISSSAHQRISVRCARKLNGVVALHPTDAFRDIYLNPNYGGQRPQSELDEAALALALSETPAAEFNAIFDQQSTIWEALGLSVQMIRGTPITNGAVVSLVRDKPQSIPIASFTEDTNIVSLSRSYLFVQSGDYDGILGEYVDPLDGSKQYILWPETAINPERTILWGCTSSSVAQPFVEQLWKQRTLRGRLTTFETEADANILKIGDPINITHVVVGPCPVLHTVASIRPGGQLQNTVEAYVYEPGVFE